MQFSGNANNGSNAGLVYSNTNNTASNAQANIGSQLSFKKMKRDKPRHLAKNKWLISGFSSANDKKENV